MTQTDWILIPSVQNEVTTNPSTSATSITNAADAISTQMFVEVTTMGAVQSSVITNTPVTQTGSDSILGLN